MPEALTSREKEVIDAIIKGKCFSRKAIANYLCVAPTTIRSHIEHIYGKLGLQESSVACLIWYYYNGDFKW